MKSFYLVGLLAVVSFLASVPFAFACETDNDCGSLSCYNGNCQECEGAGTCPGYPDFTCQGGSCIQTSCGTPAAECSGEGQSEKGGSCGDGGYLVRSCDNSCTWRGWQCEGEGGGGEEESSCDSNEGNSCNCGACGCGGTIQCDGSCSGSDPTPANYGQACGNCGTIDCSGSCINQGVCSPGSTQCSGNSVQTCSASCSWSTTTNCEDSETNYCSGGQYFRNEWVCSGGACSDAADTSIGTDVDSDNVDRECEDGVSCDIPTGKGVCQTAVAGKCAAIAGENTQAACTDNLDNDCDGLVDVNDNNCDATVQGTVTAKATGRVIQSAKVSILDQNYNEVDFAFTDSSGQYSIQVPFGTYTVLASEPDYVSEGKQKTLAPISTSTADFNLVLGTTCEADCTYAGDNTIHKECSGRNGCNFIDAAAENACNFAQPGWERVYDSDNMITCSGNPIGALKPKTQTAATVSCEEDNLVKITRIVLYKGQPVNMVVSVCS